MPKTSTLLACRACGVCGTFAHDCAKGAAASLAELDEVVVALAVAPTASSASAAAPRSQSRLCIDVLPFGVIRTNKDGARSDRVRRRAMTVRHRAMSTSHVWKLRIARGHGATPNSHGGGRTAAATVVGESSAARCDT